MICMAYTSFGTCGAHNVVWKGRVVTGSPHVSVEQYFSLVG